MPDTKITALTAIGANPIIPSTFPIPMVDLTDTSMAASGTTKKVTVNQILGAGGTATLASATITGDLTVDTSTLKVDSANNRVGVLIASPQYNLHASQLVCASDPTTNGSAGRIYGAFLNAVGEPGLDLRRWNGGGGNSHGTTFIQTNLSGDTLFYNGVEASNTRATSLKATLLANGKLLVGTSSEVGPGGILQLSAGITFPATQVASSDANTLDDYVEATFSPTVVGSTTAGTATYATQLGRYTKIGRVISFSLRVAYSAGSGTGNLRIGGLPAAGFGSNFAIYAENIALTAGNYPVCGITSGNTYIAVDQLPTGGGAAAAVPYDAAGDIQISGTYIV
jgi:hypothetical protein